MIKKAYILLVILLVSVCSCSKKTVAVKLPLLMVNNVPALAETDKNFETQLVFLLDSPALQNASFELTTEDYTAEAGKDYMLLKNELITIKTGQTQVEFPITILGDNIAEESEEFFINILNPSGVQLEQSVISITITDDDDLIPDSGYFSPESYAGMELIWQDEFSGTAINEGNWTFETGTGNNGWGNNELQYYTKENTYLQQGNLIIEARKENFGGRSYTSSRMITQNKFDFKYGRIDIRAALPYGQGIWPALWMLGANFSSVGWPACGEIDIVELIGGGIKDSKIHGTAHWADDAGKLASYGGMYNLNSGIFNDEFHVFSIIWDSTSITWYVDDIEYHIIDTSPAELSEFQDSFFLICNVAIGGNWPGSPDAATVFPQHMIIDYIRIFQDK